MNHVEVNAILFGSGSGRRFTQETPILSEVWFALAAAPRDRHDLLITPLNTIPANELLRDLLESLGENAIAATPVALRGYVALSLTFREVVDLVLPRTAWALAVGTHSGGSDPASAEERIGRPQSNRRSTERQPDRRSTDDDDRVLQLLGAIEIERNRRQREDASASPIDPDRAIAAGTKIIGQMVNRLPKAPSIWRVTLNRPIDLSDEQSRSTVKADAAFRLFDVKCSDITWAIVDSGIDDSHPAFNDAGRCRVTAAYDFTGLRALLNAGYRRNPQDNPQLAQTCAAAGLDLERGAALLAACHRAIETDTMDWSSIEQLIRLSRATAPPSGHGTHVAGIIGANWREADGVPIVVGLCPDISLLDLRILSEDIAGSEFAVISALQFIRYLNGRNQYIAVHGVNLSLSIPHRVDNYACGRTPVCDECDRLVGAGVTVVAAAGNQGYHDYATLKGNFAGYATLSITDPGNAEAVITVGSTHKREPHTYGVSYFSSRGPTGDGRAKPDLVAPGERIRSTLPNGEYGPLDGTSQAAPHVSAAAALLMAQFPELIGQPRRIKTLLIESATDLGREKAFQGAGLLDILRALQSY